MTKLSTHCAASTPVTSTHFQPLEKGTGRIAQLASTQLRLSIRICMPRRNFKSFLSGKFRDLNMTRYAAAQAQMAVHLEWLSTCLSSSVRNGRTWSSWRGYTVPQESHAPNVRFFESPATRQQKMRSFRQKRQTLN